MHAPAEPTGTVDAAPGDLGAAVARLEAAFRRIERTRMAGLPLLHPRLTVQAVDFATARPEPSTPRALPASAAPSLACGVLVTPWFMNLVQLPLHADGVAALPAPGDAADLEVGGWTFRFHGQHEAGCGRFAAASLVSPMAEFADQAAAVATARALLERLRPVPARRLFLRGRGTGAVA